MSRDSQFECYGEFIDGSWETNGCECDDCADYEYDMIEHQVENGYITDEQAREMHALNDFITRPDI